MSQDFHLSGVSNFTVFIFDHTVLKKEEDDLKDAIIYFHPQVDGDTQCALVGQVIGMSEFFGNSFPQSRPSLIKLFHDKFAVRKKGDFTLAFGGDRSFPDVCLHQLLDFMWQTFVFYQCSFELMKKNLKSEFISEVQRLWDIYVRFCGHFGDVVGQMIHIVPTVDLPKSGSSLFLHASHILQRSVHQPHVLSGTILYRSQSLCSQLPPDITKRLLLLKPRQSHCSKSRIKTDFELPEGIRLLKVFLTKKEYETIRSTKNLCSSQKKSCKKQDSFLPDLQGLGAEQLDISGISFLECSNANTEVVEDVSLLETESLISDIKMTVESLGDIIGHNEAGFPENGETASKMTAKTVAMETGIPRSDSAASVDESEVTVTTGIHKSTKSVGDMNKSFTEESMVVSDSETGIVNKEKRITDCRPIDNEQNTSSDSRGDSSSPSNDDQITKKIIQISREIDLKKLEKQSKLSEKERERVDSRIDDSKSTVKGEKSSRLGEKETDTVDGRTDESKTTVKGVDGRTDESTVPAESNLRFGVKRKDIVDRRTDESKSNVPEKNLTKHVLSSVKFDTTSSDDLSLGESHVDPKPLRRNAKLASVQSETKGVVSIEGDSSELCENTLEDGRTIVKSGTSGTLTGDFEEGGTVPLDTERGGATPLDSEEGGTIPLNSETGGAVPLSPETRRTLSLSSEKEGTMFVDSEKEGTLTVKSEKDGKVSLDSEKDGTSFEDPEKGTTKSLNQSKDGMIPVKFCEDGTKSLNSNKVESVSVNSPVDGKIPARNQATNTDETSNKNQKTATKDEEDMTDNISPAVVTNNVVPVNLAAINTRQQEEVDDEEEDMTKTATPTVVTKNVVPMNLAAVNIRNQEEEEENKLLKSSGSSITSEETVSQNQDCLDFISNQGSIDSFSPTPANKKSVSFSYKAGTSDETLQSSENPPFSPVSNGDMSDSSSSQELSSNDLLDVTLYVQGHSDMMLLLFLERGSKCEAKNITNLWKFSLSHLAELDYEVKECLEKSKSDRQAKQGYGYHFLKYDPLLKTASGNSLDPITSVGYDFINTVGKMHNSFATSTTTTEALFRTHTGCCYGSHAFNNESFFQLATPTRQPGGCPSPRDVAFSLDQIAAQRLQANHETLL